VTCLARGAIVALHGSSAEILRLASELTAIYLKRCERHERPDGLAMLSLLWQEAGRCSDALRMLQ
jgi:hypothetical protein